MRYFVQFSYCGTAYHGSQTQPNGITVQEVMENAFSTILRQPISLVFAGRTDAGVHAEKMFAHFDYPQSPINNQQSPITNLQSAITNQQSPTSNQQSTINNSPAGAYPCSLFLAPLAPTGQSITNQQSAISNSPAGAYPCSWFLAPLAPTGQSITNQQSAINSSTIQRLNSLLPSDIAIQGIYPVIDNAHARFDALSRTYEYRVTEVKDPFLQGLVARVPAGLDFAKMNEAAQYLLGRQDFASFCRVHTDVKTTFCTISQASWTPTQQSPINNSPAGAYPCSWFLAPYSPFQSPITFTITADRFLRNMVRAVVGTLFEVGKGRLSPEQFRDIISQRNRCSAGQSAPAEGLYLVDITYPPHIFRP